MPSEEDEVTLMDFLRTSNQDVPPVSNIQRKSWGSLGNVNYSIKLKKLIILPKQLINLEIKSFLLCSIND